MTGEGHGHRLLLTSLVDNRPWNTLTALKRVTLSQGERGKAK